MIIIPDEIVNKIKVFRDRLKVVRFFFPEIKDVKDSTIIADFEEMHNLLNEILGE